jgi:hypothetical protein
VLAGSHRVVSWGCIANGNGSRCGRSDLVKGEQSVSCEEVRRESCGLPCHLLNILFPSHSLRGLPLHPPKILLLPPIRSDSEAPPGVCVGNQIILGPDSESNGRSVLLLVQYNETFFVRGFDKYTKDVLEASTCHFYQWLYTIAIPTYTPDQIYL